MARRIVDAGCAEAPVAEIPVEHENEHEHETVARTAAVSGCPERVVVLSWSQFAQ